jgi:cysteine desulfuration protein SufE
VWLDAHVEGGRIWLRADSNAMITKGLVAMLVDLYSGRTPDEILGANLEFLRGVGLASHLTPSRVNGLFAMFARIQRHAKEALSTMEK